VGNFIEIYKNALSDKLCDSIIKEFEYLDKMKFTKCGETGGGENLDSKKSTDICLVEAKKLLSINTMGNTFQTGDEYTNVLNQIKDTIFKYLLEYNKKYDYYGSFINLKENNKWMHRDDFPTNHNLNYIKKLFKLNKNVLIHKYKSSEEGYHFFHNDHDVNKSPQNFCRALVCMTYLNDVREGGETEWYHQKLKIKPKKGTMVIWPAYFTHQHKGHIPISNDKYILNMWIAPTYYKKAFGS
tara:strand:- start:349 stop:1071 length:723 start_codon:yes stop_codon:yes gene_type:complete